MEFREGQSIYIQIAGYVIEQILLNKWLPGAKLISIRDLAVAMEVNPNTVQRAYDFLQQQQIIANRRGVGYFIEDEANERVILLRKEQFMKIELPVFFKNMHLLHISLDDLKLKYEAFIKVNQDNKP